MKEDSVGTIINYKNGRDKESIKEFFLYEFDENYPFFLTVIDYPLLENSNYACGMFWFRKE